MTANKDPEVSSKMTPSLLMAHVFSVVAISMIVKEALAFANVKEALAFYGVYHRHPAEGKSWSGTGSLLKYAFALHVFGWYIQIHWGHKIAEGAQPAVLDSIGGALTVAPLFAFYELLWLLGVNKDLQIETLRLVEQHTQEICSADNTTMRQSMDSSESTFIPTAETM
eukprot:scaffold22604_cov130-Cylindrotheca_fusiformis.AAC.15